jgi:hypothetical protein
MTKEKTIIALSKISDTITQVITEAFGDFQEQQLTKLLLLYKLSFHDDPDIAQKHFGQLKVFITTLKKPEDLTHPNITEFLIHILTAPRKTIANFLIPPTLRDGASPHDTHEFQDPLQQTLVTRFRQVKKFPPRTSKPKEIHDFIIRLIRTEDTSSLLLAIFDYQPTQTYFTTQKIEMLIKQISPNEIANLSIIILDNFSEETATYLLQQLSANPTNGKIAYCASRLPKKSSNTNQALTIFKAHCETLFPAGHPSLRCSRRFLALHESPPAVPPALLRYLICAFINPDQAGAEIIASKLSFEEILTTLHALGYYTEALIYLTTKNLLPDLHKATIARLFPIEDEKSRQHYLFALEEIAYSAFCATAWIVITSQHFQLSKEETASLVALAKASPCQKEHLKNQTVLAFSTPPGTSISSSRGPLVLSSVQPIDDLLFSFSDLGDQEPDLASLENEKTAREYFSKNTLTTEEHHALIDRIGGNIEKLRILHECYATLDFYSAPKYQSINFRLVHALNESTPIKHQHRAIYALFTSNPAQHEAMARVQMQQYPSPLIYFREFFKLRVYRITLTLLPLLISSDDVMRQKILSEFISSCTPKTTPFYCLLTFLKNKNAISFEMLFNSPHMTLQKTELTELLHDCPPDFSCHAMIKTKMEQFTAKSKKTKKTQGQTKKLPAATSQFSPRTPDSPESSDGSPVFVTLSSDDEDTHGAAACATEDKASEEEPYHSSDADCDGFELVARPKAQKKKPPVADDKGAKKPLAISRKNKSKKGEGKFSSHSPGRLFQPATYDATFPPLATKQQKTP